MLSILTTSFLIYWLASGLFVLYTFWAEPHATEPVCVGEVFLALMGGWVIFAIIAWEERFAQRGFNASLDYLGTMACKFITLPVIPRKKR